MWYELWDSDTGNRVGNYPTEEAALRALIEDIRLYGRESQVIVQKENTRIITGLGQDEDFPGDYSHLLTHFATYCQCVKARNGGE